MPYIDQDSRNALDPNMVLLSENINTTGQLNYCITKLCINFLKRSTINYVSLNEIPGVLECAKLEFYNRMIMPYEIRKQAINGDVYNEIL